MALSKSPPLPLSYRRLQAKQQIGEYTFHFRDEATLTAFRPALSTLVSSPEALEGFQRVQARKGRAPHVFRFEIAGKGYVGKWARSYSLLDRTRNLLRASKAQRAWENSQRLDALGIATPRVVGYAEKRIAGLVRRSLLISEQIADARKLHYFLYLFCSDPESRQLRRTLMRLVGKTLGRLHKAGVFHSDFRSANLIVQMDTSGPKVYVVDTDPIKTPGKLTEVQRLKDLTTLNFTFVKGLTTTDRLRAFRAYAGALGLNRTGRKALLRKTAAACLRSMHEKVFKPQLRPHRIPSGLNFQAQAKAITLAIESRLREKALASQATAGQLDEDGD